MAYTLSTLKKNSSDIERLTKELDKLNSNSPREEDTRFWVPTKDKAGNALAIIRFLPAPAVDGENGLPVVQYFDHAFKGPTGKWYFENSLTTLKKNDPASEFNNKLWEEGKVDTSPERAQARVQKRKLHYVSNILVVSDPKAPENEGKVFLYKYGKKLFEKIDATMRPTQEAMELDPDLKPIPVFDPWKGANLKLKVKSVKQSDGSTFPNYDDSVFVAPSAIGTDEEIEKIWKSEYSLATFVAPEQFKSYDELKKRLDEVMGFDTANYGNGNKGTTTAGRVASTSPSVGSLEPPFEPDLIIPESDEDEDLTAFKKLAEID